VKKSGKVSYFLADERIFTISKFPPLEQHLRQFKLTLVTHLKTLLSNFHILRINLGINPFKVLVEDPEGLVYLKARVKTGLARRGQVICLPKDQMIYSYVQNYGQWGSDEGVYLATLATKHKKLHHEDIILLDLGAHAGLVSKVFKNHTRPYKSNLILVDPLPLNIKAQKFNFQDERGSINHCQKAITLESGKVKFEFNIANIGASRVSSDQEHYLGENLMEVPAISARDFEIEYLGGHEKILVKSDLEGLDATILNSFSKETWSRIIGGVIEIENALKNKEDIIKLLTSHLFHYKLYWDWNSKISLNHSEVLDLWNNKKILVKNLYFEL
jgi:FkbM family methyltransferase